MTALNRKLLRDLWQMRGQALAISLVLACGITVFVTNLSMRASLVSTLSGYYEHYRFAEDFARLKRRQSMSEGQFVGLRPEFDN